jgi:hypothetical protein
VSSEPGWKEWKMGDLIYGLAIPLIFGILILIWAPYIMYPLVGGPDTALGGILTTGIFQMICITGVPILAGICWNRWAGGSAGFLMGSFYYLYVMSYYGKVGAAQDVSWQAYVVAAMVGGYIAGAIIGESFNFKRMLLVGVLVGVIQGTFLTYTLQMVYNVFIGFPGGPLSDLAGLMVPLWFYIVFTNYVPPILGAVFAVIASKLAAWFAVAPKFLRIAMQQMG